MNKKQKRWRKKKKNYNSRRKKAKEDEEEEEEEEKEDKTLLTYDSLLRLIYPCSHCIHCTDWRWICRHRSHTGTQY